MAADVQLFSHEDFCYLTTTGRITGRVHTIEIWFVLYNRTLYMLSGGLDKADWVKNIRQNASVTVKIKDKIFVGQGRDVKSAEEDALARRMIEEKYPSSDEEDLTTWYASALPIAIDLQV